MKGPTLNQREQRRLQVLNRVLGGQLRVKEACGLLGVGERHGWRLLAAYREEGAAALAHGNRGRPPAHKTPEAVRQRVVELAQGVYQGFNHCHLTELLAEREGIHLSRSTVRRVLAAVGLRSPRHRRPAQHRSRRERYPQEGMLLQVDGSRRRYRSALRWAWPLSSGYAASRPCKCSATTCGGIRRPRSQSPTATMSRSSS